MLPLFMPLLCVAWLYSLIGELVSFAGETDTREKFNCFSEGKPLHTNMFMKTACMSCALYIVVAMSNMYCIIMTYYIGLEIMHLPSYYWL